ncbi:MAG TPA: tetratricopeptide repeat protein [Terracidiphilus sp.]|nr:tetratricopeptide repeat protein [Terracidiphilus sp.]
MKLSVTFMIVLAAGATASTALNAQSQPAQSQPSQSQPAHPPGQPANGQNKPGNQPANSNNPFPEDESTVPMMPNRNTIDTPAANGAASDLLPLPGDDVDPVHSPDEGQPAAESGSSSSLAGLDAIDPDSEADADTQPAGRHGKRQQVEEPEHKETAAEDESVGKYYLESKDWKAALSRYESALVLDPENPDVYWGLAESDRHLGRFAEARENYQKVMEYDPGSRHAKDAGKALKEPEIANARAVPQTEPAQAQPQ